MTSKQPVFKTLTPSRRAKLTQMFKDGAVECDERCIDLKGILPGFSFKAGHLFTDVLREGVDFEYREISDGHARRTLMLFSASGAIHVVKRWHAYVAPCFRESCIRTQEETVEAIELYRDLYPIQTAKRIEECASENEEMSAISEMLISIMERIEVHGIGVRKDFPPHTISAYVNFMADRRSGRCPLSGAQVVKDRQLCQGAEVDHFYSRSYNAIDGGWIITSVENKKLRNTAYRAKITTRFLAFQDELKQWIEESETPLLNESF